MHDNPFYVPDQPLYLRRIKVSEFRGHSYCSMEAESRYLCVFMGGTSQDQFDGSVTYTYSYDMYYLKPALDAKELFLEDLRYCLFTHYNFVHGNEYNFEAHVGRLTTNTFRILAVYTKSLRDALESDVISSDEKIAFFEKLLEVLSMALNILVSMDKIADVALWNMQHPDDRPQLRMYFEQLN